jgi:hypothetical protein
MKLFTFLLFISLFTVYPALAQPHVSADTTVYNFGSIKQGRIVRHTFIIRNTGNQPLIINDVDPDCGCVRINFTHTPIPPGKTARIDLVFVSKKKLGTQFLSTQISTNADNPLFLVFFKGEVYKGKKKKSKS